MVFMVFPSGHPPPKKYKAACDQCHKSKLKCPGGGPPCKRCSDMGHQCHYSLAARIGKQPGTKNRKTLERLRQASAIGVGDGLQTIEASVSIRGAHVNEEDVTPKQLDAGRSCGNGVDNHGAVRMSELQEFHSPSPLDDYLGFLSTPPSSIPSPGCLLEFDSSTYFQESSHSETVVLDAEMPFFPATSKDELRTQWTNLSPEDWSPWIADADIREWRDLSPDADAPFDRTSQGTPGIETIGSASMDAALTMLEEKREGSANLNIRPIKQQPDIKRALCHCLRNYADILCQLYTVEKRQCPIRVDTFLMCTNQVLGAISQFSDCPDCQFDMRVFTQLVMIFETLLTWAQSYSSSPKLANHSAGNAGLDLTTVNIGCHELTPEEILIVRTTLHARAVAKIGAALKNSMSRIEHAAKMAMGTCWEKPHHWGAVACDRDKELDDLRLRTDRLLHCCNALEAKMTTEKYGAVEKEYEEG